MDRLSCVGVGMNGVHTSALPGNLCPPASRRRWSPRAVDPERRAEPAGSPGIGFFQMWCAMITTGAHLRSSSGVNTRPEERLLLEDGKRVGRDPRAAPAPAARGRR